jgi:uncharacterized zinc-type alcohol dehydrogenase-like protein
MPHALAYGAQSPTSPLAGLTIERREPGPTDVKIDIRFCGVCHSDLHTARGEWAGTKYPSVPGHEIVGEVVAVGAEVSRFKLGDLVGVGCMVDSCRECDSCRAGLEQYCYEGNVGTYNGKDRHLGGHTFGGYSQSVVVDQDFVLSIPANLPLDAAAPLLCAGITLYSPLMHWQAGPGKTVGIVGLGGLGHMGVKIARALGAHVLLGVPPTPFPPLDVARMIGNRLTVAASTIGGIRETQDMLDFCGRHGIVSDIELIRMDQINHAYERMLKGDIKYRFVIDMATI